MNLTATGSLGSGGPGLEAGGYVLCSAPQLTHLDMQMEKGLQRVPSKTAAFPVGSMGVLAVVSAARETPKLEPYGRHTNCHGDQRQQSGSGFSNMVTSLM